MDTPALPCLDRRCVLTAAAAAGAVVALGGCSTYGGQQAAPAPAAPASSEAAPSSASASAAAPPAAASGASGASAASGASGNAPAAAKPSAAAAPVRGIAALADIPVGGGKILAGQGIVITQPTAGTVKAFSTVCTHAGCTVSEVAGGTINCPCHGSKFAIADGSVAGGPAPRPLPPIVVTVKGGQVVRA
jgi:Rieske Fe-S protein